MVPAVLLSTDNLGDGRCFVCGGETRARAGEKQVNDLRETKTSNRRLVGRSCWRCEWGRDETDNLEDD